MTTNDPDNVSTSVAVTHSCSQDDDKDNSLKSKCNREKVSTTEEENAPTESQDDTKEIVATTGPLAGERASADQKQIPYLILQAKDAMMSDDFEKAATLYADLLELLVPSGADPFLLVLAPIYYCYGICLLNAYVSQNQLLSHEIPAEIPPIENDSESTGRKRIIQLEPSIDEEETNHQEDSELARHRHYNNKLSKENQGSSSSVSRPNNNILEKEIDLLHAQEAQIIEILEADPNGSTEEAEDDLQLAWEVLDTARIIYSRNDSGERLTTLLLADVNVALGDVGLECENFGTAFDDFATGLRLKQQWLEPTDRAIAELYYKMALALELDGKGPMAIEYVEKALALLNERSDGLKKQLAAFVDSHENNSKKLEEKKRLTEELDDLFALIPDLVNKIDELKRSSVTDLPSVELTDPLTRSSLDGKEKAMDISSLVRKKEKKHDVNDTVDYSEPSSQSIPNEFTLGKDCLNKRVKREEPI